MKKLKHVVESLSWASSSNRSIGWKQRWPPSRQSKSGVRVEHTSCSSALGAVGKRIKSADQSTASNSRRSNIDDAVAANDEYSSASSTDVISLHDSRGRRLYVSPSVVTLMGYEPDELLAALRESDAAAANERDQLVPPLYPLDLCLVD